MAIKTLHITNHYHPASGGIRTFYHALLEAANELQRPMRLVVPGEENRVEEAGEFGRIYYLQAPHCPVFDPRYRLILPHTFLFPPLAQPESVALTFRSAPADLKAGATRAVVAQENGLRRILRMEQPDLVEICDKYSLPWLAGLLRRNLIAGVQRPTLVGLSCERMDDNVRAYVTPSALAQRLSDFYIRNIYVPLFDFHIAVSHYVAEELTGGGPALRNRLQVLPMGLHAERLGPQRRNPQLRSRLQKESGGNHATALLLYAGRLSPEKNLELLVAMMEHLHQPEVRGNGQGARATPECRLLIAGSGQLQRWLREQNTRLGGRLHFLGQLASPSELAPLLASVDAFVHPNPREPFGIGPLEAMASGTPLIAPRAGGVLDYADPNCAWLVEPDGEAFARAVLDVLSNRAKAQAKVERALAVAQHYQWRKVAHQFFDTYEAFHALRPQLFRQMDTPCPAAAAVDAGRSSAGLERYL
jgi:glycosyltransferase involved in cell wall biosynthesis